VDDRAEQYRDRRGGVDLDVLFGEPGRGDHVRAAGVDLDDPAILLVPRPPLLS
jgi:hypothetical protein